jgi:hypothetical protein
MLQLVVGMDRLRRRSSRRDFDFAKQRAFKQKVAKHTSHLSRQRPGHQLFNNIFIESYYILLDND